MARAADTIDHSTKTQSRAMHNVHGENLWARFFTRTECIRVARFDGTHVHSEIGSVERQGRHNTDTRFLR
eukprot:jgi/Antlo1/70/1263